METPPTSPIVGAIPITISTALGWMLTASGAAQEAFNGLVPPMTPDQYQDLTELQDLTKKLQQLQAKYLPPIGS